MKQYDDTIKIENKHSQRVNTNKNTILIKKAETIDRLKKTIKVYKKIKQKAVEKITSYGYLIDTYQNVIDKATNALNKIKTDDKG